MNNISNLAVQKGGQDDQLNIPFYAANWLLVLVTGKSACGMRQSTSFETLERCADVIVSHEMRSGKIGLSVGSYHHTVALAVYKPLYQ